MVHLSDWVVSIVVTVLGTGFAGWLWGFIGPASLSPQRVRLALRNLLSFKPPKAEGKRFLVVLCWLNKDAGDDADTVAGAFTHVEGIDLVRSATIVAAPFGRKGEWINGMKQPALAVLNRFNADLTIAGEVKQAGSALNLWFIPRSGDGTLTRGDRPYVLENVTLGTDFHQHLAAQVIATAFTAIAPVLDDGTLGRMQRNGLHTAIAKLTHLLAGDAVPDPLKRADLQLAIGHAFFALGRREMTSEHIKQAISAYEDAAPAFQRDTEQLRWASVHHAVGRARVELGRRASGSEQLEEAERLYRTALAAYPRAEMPFDRVLVQLDLGRLLQMLGERDANTRRLHLAARYFRVANARFARAGTPRQRAMAQFCLGRVLTTLGERCVGIKLLQQAVGFLHNAIDNFQRELDPLDWGMAHGHLGWALALLGERQRDQENFKEALAAHEAAQRVVTEAVSPVEWSHEQMLFGATLNLVGLCEGSKARHSGAVRAHMAALRICSRKHWPRRWSVAQGSLGTALYALGRLERNPKRLREALDVLEAAFEEVTPDNNPSWYAHIEFDYSSVLLTLGEWENNTDFLQTALSRLDALIKRIEGDALPIGSARAQSLRVCGFLILATTENTTAHFHQATNACRAALQVVHQDDRVVWAYLQHYLGMSLAALGVRDELPELVVEALDHLKCARKVFSADCFSNELANTLCREGEAHAYLGLLQNKRERLLQAGAAFQAALDILGTDISNPVKEHARKKLEDIHRDLSELRDDGTVRDSIPQ